MNTIKAIVAQDRRGFTLIELVVVIAILGILAAIAVPVITSYLGSSKERAYVADQARFQAAADAYFSNPSNDRFTGKRQYPVLAKAKGGSSGATTEASVSGSSGPLTISVNPVGATEGGTPFWQDDTTGDGLRATTGEVLVYHGSATSTEHWNTTQVTRGGVAYAVDSRDWFVDFDELVTGDWLDSVPPSASPDNKTGATGSYGWFVDGDGKVRSLFYFFPISSDSGYKDVYP